MPTYEYLCKNCGERLEVFQKFSAKPLRVHDECGGDLQKVFHASGVVFKGSGYYVTDSRASAASTTKSEAPGAKDDSKTTTKEKSSSAESKPSESKTSKSKSDSKSSKTSDAAAAS